MFVFNEIFIKLFKEIKTGKWKKMIPGIIKNGLVEIGGLEPEILEINRNGSKKGYIGNYDNYQFYIRRDAQGIFLILERDDPRIVDAFEKWQGYRFRKREVKIDTTTYEWFNEDWGKEGFVVYN